MCELCIYAYMYNPVSTLLHALLGRREQRRKMSDKETTEEWENSVVRRWIIRRKKNEIDGGYRKNGKEKKRTRDERHKTYFCIRCVSEFDNRPHLSHTQKMEKESVKKIYKERKWQRQAFLKKWRVFSAEVRCVRACVNGVVVMLSVLSFFLHGLFGGCLLCFGGRTLGEGGEDVRDVLLNSFE